MTEPQADTRLDSREYEAPALRLLGSVAALTQQTVDKKLGPTDGFTFMGAPIANASP
jgi:hypothetical protein